MALITSGLCRRFGLQANRYKMAKMAADDDDDLRRAISVFADGPLLKAVQLAAPPIFADSKHFVDMPLREEPELVLAEFAKLPGAPVAVGETVILLTSPLHPY